MPAGPTPVGSEDKVPEDNQEPDTQAPARVGPGLTATGMSQNISQCLSRGGHLHARPSKHKHPCPPGWGGNKHGAKLHPPRRVCTEMSDKICLLPLCFMLEKE